MRIDIGKMLVAARVGRLGSVTLAAKSLHLTPSAVSQQIQALEKSLGTKLFDRRPHGVELTQAGEVVVASCNEIHQTMELMESNLRQLTEGISGRIRFGVFPTFASSLLPSVMNAFRDKYSGVTLDVQSQKLRSLALGLASGDLDAALTWEYIDGESYERDHHVSFDPTVVLLPLRHRLTRQAEVEMADLADEHLVVRAGNHPGTDLLHRLAAAEGFSPRVVVSAHDYQETQAMVAAEIGIALVPLLSTWTCRSDVAILPVKNAPRRQLKWRLGATRSVAATTNLFNIVLSISRDFENEFLRPDFHN